MKEIEFQAYLQQCNRENVLSKAVFRTALENPEERLPLLKELIVELGYSVIEYDIALHKAREKTEGEDFYADSMNAPAAEDSETESGDLIPDERAEQALKAVDDEAENSYFREHLEAALTELTPIQAAVIRGRFYRKQTRPQVAEALHTTPQAVRQAEAAGLQALRKNRGVQKIGEDYIEMAAYHGTGWCSWYYELGSVEERTIEGMEKKRWI